MTVANTQHQGETLAWQMCVSSQTRIIPLYPIVVRYADPVPPALSYAADSDDTAMAR